MTEIDKLLDIMARLRDPETGCPWDKQQSFATIAPHTIEEAYEVADAIAQNNLEGLRDELGDLLFQVVFYAQMAREIDAFDFAGVVDTICEKMRRRHPHVFGDADIANAEAQTRSWEDLKARERAEKQPTSDQPPSALDGVARALPALAHAAKLQKRAARVGFDWPDAEPVIDKIHEELAELAEARASGDAAAVEDEIGDLLFACVNVARHLHVDPETALRQANRKFDRRFRVVERSLAAQGRSAEAVDLDELEALWVEAKRAATGST